MKLPPHQTNRHIFELVFYRLYTKYTRAHANDAFVRSMGLRFQLQVRCSTYTTTGHLKSITLRTLPAASRWGRGLRQDTTPSLKVHPHTHRPAHRKSPPPKCTPVLHTNSNAFTEIILTDLVRCCTRLRLSWPERIAAGTSASSDSYHVFM